MKLCFFSYTCSEVLVLDSWIADPGTVIKTSFCFVVT